MRGSLMFATSLVRASGFLGFVGSAAYAEDGITLRIGGNFNSAYQVVIDDDGQGEAGDDRNSNNFFSDAEIDFDGRTVLDNGLEVGAHLALLGETDDQQIDSAYWYFSAGWGEVRFGSDDEVLANMCVTAPGASSNFSAFSPNQWAANVAGPLDTNPVCNGVDDEGSAQKIVYYSPIFHGFQLGLSYTPSGGRKSQIDGVGPHLGMPPHGFDEDGDGNVDTTESRHNVSAYAAYVFESEDWELMWGIGGAWTGKMESVPGNADANRSVYQTGFNLEIDDFSVGAVFEYFNNYASVSGVDGFVVGGGIEYDLEPWTIGLQYSHGRFDIANEFEDNDTRFFDSGDNFTLNRLVATAELEFAPGINFDAELGYTWANADGNSEQKEADGYDAIEFGIGSAIEF